MNLTDKIIAILKDAKTPLRASQILALLKLADPYLTIEKKELNQIIWKELKQQIIYNTSDFTIILRGSALDQSIPEFKPDSKFEVRLVDVLKIVAEEKIRLGTHEANLLAENITIRLKNKYGVN